MKQYLLLLILTCLTPFQKIYADPIINFFLYPYPYINEAHQDLTHAGHIATQKIHGTLNHNSGAGIFSTYGGYIDITNLNGQTFYPRLRSEQYLYLFITDTITPVFRFANTLECWQLSANRPVAIFKMEKKQDEKTKLFIWDVQPASRPENNLIPPADSLVIIANPQNIYVPLGVSVADNTPHLLLPPIYVKKGINIVKNGLYMITISQFFSPSRVLYTKAEKSYIMHTR